MSENIKLHAKDISCDHCAMTIKRELGPVEGVVSVDVDVPSKTVVLQHTDAAALARVKALMEDIGYPVSES